MPLGHRVLVAIRRASLSAQPLTPGVAVGSKCPCERGMSCWLGHGAARKASSSNALLPCWGLRVGTPFFPSFLWRDWAGEGTLGWEGRQSVTSHGLCR